MRTYQLRLIWCVPNFHDNSVLCTKEKRNGKGKNGEEEVLRTKLFSLTKVLRSQRALHGTEVP